MSTETHIYQYPRAEKEINFGAAIASIYYTNQVTFQDRYRVNRWGFCIDIQVILVLGQLQLRQRTMLSMQTG